MIEITRYEFWSIMRRSIKKLILSPRRLMNAMSGMPLWRCVLLIIVALVGVEDVARGGFFFQGGEDHLVVDNSNNTLYVGNSEETDCYYRVEVKALKSVTSAQLGWWYKRGKPKKPGVYLAFGEGTALFYCKSNFEKVDMFGNPCSGESSALDSPTFAGTDKQGNTIAVSNDGDVLDITCDGRFAIVVGANSETPVSLVDLASQKEVDTFAYDGLARSVAACDDGQSVLVVFGSNDGTNSELKRLTITETGTLTDTGEALTPGSDESIRRVCAVPGSKSGVAIVSNNSYPYSARLVSFAIPGLQTLDSATLANRLDIAVAVSCAGDKVYVRSGSGGSSPDVIEGFSYDPETGEISDTPSVTITNVSFVNLTVYENPLAVTTDGARVLASGTGIYSDTGGTHAKGHCI